MKRSDLLLSNEMECGGTRQKLRHACPIFDNRGHLEDLEQIENGIAVSMTPPTIPKSMIVANPQSNAPSKPITVKSPVDSPSDRDLKIKAAIERATKCIVTHMRNQILSGKNGL